MTKKVKIQLVPNEELSTVLLLQDGTPFSEVTDLMGFNAIMDRLARKHPHQDAMHQLFRFQYTVIDENFDSITFADAVAAMMNGMTIRSDVSGRSYHTAKNEHGDVVMVSSDKKVTGFEQDEIMGDWNILDPNSDFNLTFNQAWEEMNRGRSVICEGMDEQDAIRLTDRGFEDRNGLRNLSNASLRKRWKVVA